MRSPRDPGCRGCQESSAGDCGRHGCSRISYPYSEDEPRGVRVAPVSTSVFLKPQAPPPLLEDYEIAVLDDLLEELKCGRDPLDSLSSADIKTAIQALEQIVGT